MLRSIALVTSLAAIAFAAPALAGSPVLYAWASHAKPEDGGFLAVIDADPKSKTYGKVVSTAPTGEMGGSAHHIEYEMPGGKTLFANDWGTGRTFVFDIRDKRRPKVSAAFDRAGDYIYPHSFARLPNGNVVATFQSIGEKYAPPGGLAELDAAGRLVRGSPSATPDIPTAVNWPYSLTVVPAADRIVTTSTDMGRGKNWKSPPTSHVQLWSMKDFRLVASLALPESPNKGANIYPAEPRMLSDGSIYVSTFSCGLYRLEDIAGPKAKATFVHAFSGGTGEHDMCAVPLVYGKYWIQTTGSNNGLTVLDVSDPARPREVSRMSLPHRWHMPHWIGADRAGGRIAVTGQQAAWLAMLNFDEKTGTLSLDESFGDGGGITMPSPNTGREDPAITVHGVVFAR